MTAGNKKERETLFRNSYTKSINKEIILAG